MKTFKMLAIAIIAMVTSLAVKAQSSKSDRNAGIKTELIRVYGNCAMDKKRIEKAAYSTNGVKEAVWSEDKQILTLKYSVSIENVADNVQKRIASAGNDTGKYRADDAVYQKLPDCCHYQRKKS